MPSPSHGNARRRTTHPWQRRGWRPRPWILGKIRVFFWLRTGKTMENGDLIQQKPYRKWIKWWFCAMIRSKKKMWPDFINCYEHWTSTTGFNHQRDTPGKYSNKTIDKQTEFCQFQRILLQHIWICKTYSLEARLYQYINIYQPLLDIFCCINNQFSAFYRGSVIQPDRKVGPDPPPL